MKVKRKAGENNQKERVEDKEGKREKRRDKSIKNRREE